MIPVSAAYPLGPVSCGVLAILTRPCRAFTRRSPSARSLRTRIVWLAPCTLLPSSTSFVVRGRQPRSGPRWRSRSLGSRGPPYGWRGERSCGAGRWPGRDREQRGWRRCARACLPIGLPGQSRNGRISWPCWPKGIGNTGEVQEGLRVLAEALAAADTTGERYCEAELHRLKGELLLLQSADQHAEAEACFHQALAIARRQQAKSLEAARRHEPGAAVAAAGQAHGSARSARADLRLVHRGL